MPSRTIFKESITKEMLSMLVWEMPIKVLSEKFHTYPKIVREVCEEWKIKKPEPHYWQKLLRCKNFEEYKRND